MIIRIRFLLCFLALSGLVSCGIPARDPRFSSQEGIEQQYQAVSVLLTQTAQVEGVSTTATPASTQPLPAGDPTKKPTTVSTPAVFDTLATTPTNTFTPAAAPSGGKALAAPCDLAQLGFPIDITVPDGTHFQPGDYFSKTWRLVNAGSCQWTPEYAVVWFSGMNMAIYQAQPLSVVVRPGGSMDVTIDMVAPPAPGTYQSNWKLRNQDGVMFGIGPSGDAPFWVRIVVDPVDTPTPTPPAIDATPTPIIYASGSLALLLGEGVDLDSAQINQAGNDDLRLDSSPAGDVQLTPLTGAHIKSFGMETPRLYECDQTEDSSASVGLKQEQIGAYLCYRTTKGLPGWLTIKAVDLETGQIELEFVTWAVP